MFNCLRILILAAASILSMPAIATSLDSLFLKAEEVKSQGRDSFTKTLTQIEAQASELSSEQKIELEYHKVYFDALYNGKLADAPKKYSELVTKTNNSSLKFRILSSLFYVNTNLRDYPRALSNLSQLNQLAKFSGNELMQIRSRLFSQEFFLNVKKYEQSIELGNELLERNLPQREECFVRWAIAQAKWRSNQVDFSDMEKANSACIQAKEFVMAKLVHLLFSYHYLKEGNADELGKRLYNEVDPKEFEASLYLKIPYKYLEAEYLFLKGNIDQAQSNLKFVFDNDKALNTPEFILGAYSLAIKLYQEKSNYQAALKAYQTYDEKKSQYLDEEAKGLYAYYLAENDAAQMENKLELLNKENQLLALNKELSEKEINNSRLLLALLITLLVLSALLIFRSRKRQVQMAKMMEVDQLTQVSTRHYFYQKSRQVLPACESRGLEVSFIIFDLDKFKNVNDTYGHLIGDRVLKNSINVVKDCWRKDDLIGRLGGEEFAVLLPDCELERAKEIAEECRSTIARADLTGLGRKLNITASFGITSSKYSGYQLKGLIADADRMMYQSKAKGRNQITTMSVADSAIQNIHTLNQKL